MSYNNIQDIYKLSPIQQGMLFHNLYTPESAVYFEQFSWTSSDIDIELFVRAWQHLVDRHPILRTSFFWEDLDEPLQLVHRQATLPVERFNWSDLSPEERARRLPQFLRDDRARGFELSQAPLMRLSIIQMHEQSFQITWSYHHLLLDGWSVALVLEEVFATYAALIKGQTPQRPRRRPYRDYIAWLGKQDTSAAEDFWRDLLRGFSAPTRLRLERGPEPAPIGGETYDFRVAWLSEETNEKLQTLARQERITLNTIVQGAWALLLSRYSGDSDLVYGITVAGRPPELTGFDTMIGCFINTLPMRVKIAPDRSLLEWLKDLNQQQVALRQYEYTPLAEIQRWSDVSRGTPLFETIVVFENYPIETFGRQRNAQIFQRTNYPLTLVVEPGESMRLRFGYETQRFDDATIEGLLERLQVVLQNMVVQLDRRVTEVELLTPAERQKLLTAWNATTVAYPQDLTLHSLVAAQAAQTPEAIAVRYEDQTLTYAELDRRTNQLAHLLRRHGVGPEQRVGVYMERSLELVVALLGILKAGGAYVALDPEYPKDRVQFMLEDAQAAVLLTQERLVAQLAGSTGRILALDSTWATLAGVAERAPESGVTPDNIAYVIYTSGSTGRPKGVLNSHRGIVNRLLWMQDEYHLTSADRVLQKTPYSFDVSVWEFFWPLITGATLVMARPGGHRNSAYLARLIDEQQITTLHFVPSMLNAFLEDPDAGRCRSLKRVICSGEALSFDLQQRFFARLAAELHNLYGPTEAAVDVSYWACIQNDERPVVPIGRPVANTQLYILDRYGQPVPVGVPGELHIGGVQLARGYHDRPALTAEKFIPNPFASNPGARLYKTGDLARYLPDGAIEFGGRIDHQVKLRGFRIELGEIEAVLHQHPGVREAIVLARQDIPGDTRLVAYVVGEQGTNEQRSEGVEPAEDQANGWGSAGFASFDSFDSGQSLLDTLGSGPWIAEPSMQLSSIFTDSLRAFVQERLPEYMIPSSFVVLPSLPLTPNGKVDRKALPAPDMARPELETAFVVPRTPTEEVVAAIWQKVLSAKRVGIYDSFFELGGHSLLATQILSRVREAFQVDLALSNLFNTPTVAGMSAQIDTARQTARGLQAPPITPVPHTDDLPLSYAQQRLWFLHQIDPSSPTYNIPAAVQLRGDVDLVALERCLNAIVSRHESLRTTFHLVNGQPVQRIAATLTLPLPVIDLTNLTPDEQKAQMSRLAVEEAQQPFDLKHGPVIRATILKQSDQVYVLLVTMHHIVADGWSIGVFIREIAILYKAFSSGQTPAQSPLPDLPIQYADYAVWQRQWLQGEVWEEQQNYWKEQLSGSLAVLNLPTDRPRPPIQTQRGLKYIVSFPKALSEGLAAVSRQAGATLFMTLLSGLNVLLYRYTGQTDILIGSPIANRHYSSVEGLIGMFINTLVLRTDLSGNPTYRELLSRVRDIALGAYAHQDLPFEQVVEIVEPQRDLSRPPLFQVMFILQNAPLPSLELGNVSMLPIEVDNKTAKFDITFELTETEDGILGFIEYNTDLFETATIERMMLHFQQILESIADNLEQQIGSVSLLTDAERQQILYAWNDTAVPFPQPHLLPQLFEAQVARDPQAIALRADDHVLTYAALNARANQLAHYLQALNVGPDTRVGLCLERSPELVVALLAILKAGGAYVPLDPAYPPERLAFMLSDAQVTVLVTQHHLRQRLPLPDAPVVCLDCDGPQIAQQPSTAPPTAVQDHHLAYVIYTSGSTGKPKGVLVDHRNLANVLLGSQHRFGFHEGDCLPWLSSVAFDISLFELGTTLLTGGTVLVLTQAEILNLPQLSTTLQRCTLLHAVPSLLRQVVQTIEQQGGEPAAYQGLRRVFTGGEAVPPELLADLQRVFPAAQVTVLYGPTEGTIICSGYDVPRDEVVRGHPIGRPLPNTQLRLYDAHDQLVPVGVPGEIVIGGTGVARGYLHQPALTAERFVARDGQRWYKTGDMARYLPDGTIEFLGRTDAQVKLRGFRIELGEIETVLRQHEAVHDAVVLLRDERLVAYVVRKQKNQGTTEQGDEPDGSASPRGNPVLDPSNLRPFLHMQLPDYMVPSAFVVLDALPTNAHGKIDRNALPAPEKRSGKEESYVAPRTELERQLAGIWQELLGVEHVGINDNFFDLGGHSLTIVQVHSACQTLLQRDIPMVDLFKYPTISSLAAYLSMEQQEHPADNSGIDRVETRRESTRRQQERRQQHRAARRHKADLDD